MSIKQILIRVGVLSGVFIVAVLVFSVLTNRGTTDNISDLEAATLPRIYFEFEGHEVNNIAGYVDDMDITAMRDTVIPIGVDGTLTMQLERFGNEINQVVYDVYTLSGEMKLASGTGQDKDGAMLFNLRNVLEQAGITEAVMKVTLIVEDSPVYYYLRILQPKNLSTKACIDYARDFHENTFKKEMKNWVEQCLETDAEVEDNTTYQTVSIYSDVEHVMWGSLNPEVVGDVVWSIKESNETYTSILAEYRVSCTDEDGNPQIYNVQEFFRVRVGGQSIFLLNYNRTMNQVFHGRTANVLTDKGIILGITEPNVEYEVNSKGTIVSFVQERELWSYNQKEDELAKVFSFADESGTDIRCSYDQHDVRIISVDDDGSTTFAVYGYMNRGDHEGEVGVNIFYYDLPKNSVEEKAFIPTDKSFAMAEEELGKLVYYNHDANLLYVLAGGTLYQIDLTKNRQTEVATGLDEGQYTASSDGHLLAYQPSGDLNTATVLKVLNLESGEEQEVEAGSGEYIRPLGFIFDDMVYGLLRSEDAGITISGEEMIPMYKLEIRDQNNDVVKTYEVPEGYISDISIDYNQITVNRVAKMEDVYSKISADYITNNEEKEKSNIELESFVTDSFETQYRLAYANGISDRSPKLLTPGMVQANENVTVAFETKESAEKYIVFGTGEVAGIYEKASYAIAKADELCGVVITTDQKYVWVRGNRDLEFDTEFPAFGIPEGKNSYQACDEQLQQFNGTRVDLTGCTVSQVCYLINQGIPVIAMTDVNHAILLTAYTESTVTYIDPDNGSVNTVSVEDMTNMAAGSGNTFIGYIR